MELLYFELSKVFLFIIGFQFHLIFIAEKCYIELGTCNHLKCVGFHLKILVKIFEFRSYDIGTIFLYAFAIMFEGLWGSSI